MNAWLNVVACSLALSTVVATRAAAQQDTAGSKCEINFSNPSEVKDAFSDVTIAQMGKNPDDAKKRLQDAIKKLTEHPEKINNDVAREYVLGQALVNWSMQPGVTPVMPRQALGYASGPQGNVDVLAAADSALTAATTASPTCASQIDQIRQQAWAPLINKVGGLINSNNLDSAKVLLARANTIYRGSPYNYYFAGNIAQRDSDYAAASDAFQKALALATPQKAAKDSNMASIREYVAFSVGYTTLMHAEQLTGDQQKSEMAKAAAAYQAYLKEYPNGQDVSNAQAGLTRTLQASGDSAGLSTMWAQMSASPAKYSAGQLYDAGAGAFRVNDLQTAAKLMEAAYQKNPYLIAGLFNLSNVYWKLKDWEKMAKVSHELLSLAPNDPDNWQLLAIAEQNLAKATNNAKLQKARNDSVVAVLTKGNKLPVRISFSRMAPADSSYTLSGTAENLLSKPGTYTINFSFLDPSGNVVTTKTATVSLGPKSDCGASGKDSTGKACKPVAGSNASQDFTVEVDQPGIVAFRYAPVS
ncbi:MAG TPA: tetratricopeptide repeat protein [Gemmatimonadaceae bacterium]|nr:tetratricopeptide repeat protein [Gemmatimonadaceae bacterium]